MYLFMYLLKVLLNYLSHYYITWKKTSLEILINQKSRDWMNSASLDSTSSFPLRTIEIICTTGIPHNN